MRFLMLNWRDPANPTAGGAERVSLAYLSALAQRGHEVFWFANDFPAAKPTEEINGVQFARGGGKGTSIVAAYRWFRRQKPFDLVIDQHHGIPWYAPWWCGTKCIAYIHEVLGPIWNSFYEWPVADFGQWQERWTHWLYRDVPFWTPSESTRKDLLAHGVRDVTVIPNGCDTVPLPALEPKPLAAPLRLVAVSRLAPNKRVDHAIELVRTLLDRNVEAQLTVVGGGEEAENLKQLAAARGLEQRVVFTGPLPEERKNEVLRQAHFLVHASVREGWGLNVLEANAMSTPAVVYPVAGLVDSTVDRQTGWIVAQESPAALADAIMEVLKSPDGYEACRVKAWERVKEFQWEVVLPRACDWLEEQAAKKRLVQA